MTLWSVSSADVLLHCFLLFCWLRSRSCLFHLPFCTHTEREESLPLIFHFDRPSGNQHSFLILSYKAFLLHLEKRAVTRQLFISRFDQADSTFLPLALLAASTFLPFAVLILALKPCTFDLDLFLGWKVIFIKQHLPYHTPGLSVAVFIFNHQWHDGNSLTQATPRSENIGSIILKKK